MNSDLYLYCLSTPPPPPDLYLYCLSLYISISKHVHPPDLYLYCLSQHVFISKHVHPPTPPHPDSLTKLVPKKILDSNLKSKLFFCFFVALTPFCSVAFRGQLLKTEIFEEEEEETLEETPAESVSPAPGAKTDSTKKTEKTKSDKQKPVGKANGNNASGEKIAKVGVSRGASGRASSPAPSSRPASAVVKEKKKPG